MKAIERVRQALGGNVVPMARPSGITTGFGSEQEGIAVQFPKPQTREFREQATAFRACGIHMGLVIVTVQGSLVDCSIYPSHKAVAEAAGIKVV